MLSATAAKEKVVSKTVVSIDEVSGPSKIADLWMHKYSTLLNSNRDTTHTHSVLEVIEKLNENAIVRFSAEGIVASLNKLKSGKSADLDGLQAEHFRNAPIRLSVIITMFFNAMLMHMHITGSVMETVIVPVVKDKKSSITSSNNYQPVAVTTIFSKLLEILILKRCSSCLETSHNQF